MVNIDCSAIRSNICPKTPNFGPLLSKNSGIESDISIATINTHMTLKSPSLILGITS